MQTSPPKDFTDTFLHMLCNSTITNSNAHDILFMQCPLPMWIFDSENFRFLEVNQAAITQYGYTREEFLRMTILNIRPPEDICSVIDIASESKRTRGPYQYNHRHTKKNGDLIQVNIASNYIEYEGRAARVVLILDMTEILQTREKLSLSNRRFKSLLQRGTEFIAILTTDFKFTFVGPTSLSMLGISPNTFIGKDALDFIHDDDRDRIAEEFNALQNIKTINLSPFRFKTIHGEWRWLDTTLTNLVDDEAVAGIVCNANDITFKMQEVDRRMQEEKWSKILESVVIHTLDGVMVTDADQENGTPIIYVNQAILNSSGYTRDELIGKSPTIFHGENTEQPGLKVLGEALKEKKPCKIELANYTKTGKEYYISITISPILNYDGEVTHWISIQKDITEYKSRIEQMELEIQNLKQRIHQ